MQTWTIKLDDEFAKEIEKAMKPLYSTKTEIVREALRKHVKDLEKERALVALRENFGKGRGIAKTAMTDRQVREKVSKELLRTYGLE